jgi:hypothetical protein
MDAERPAVQPLAADDAAEPEALVVGAGFPGHLVPPGRSLEPMIDFLQRCAWRYPQGPVDCVLDDASYHSTPEVKAWLSDHPSA